MEAEDKKRLLVSFLAGLVIVLLVGGSFVYFVSRNKRGAGAAVEPPLPFGAAEQAYAVHVHFVNPQMSRLANFLNQEVTYISGTVSNDGARDVREIEVTLEFHDPFNQAVLRETRRLLGSRAQPLGGGERRDFQIALEHVSAEWNQQYPSIKIVGLTIE
jgi:hypothetical protein